MHPRSNIVVPAIGGVAQASERRDLEILSPKHNVIESERIAWILRYNARQRICRAASIRGYCGKGKFRTGRGAIADLGLNAEPDDSPIGRDGDAVLLDLIEDATAAIRMYQWGLSDISAAKVETIENLYSSGAEAQGVYLAGITFEQQIAFGSNLADTDLGAAVTAAGQTGFFEGLETFHGLSAEERLLAMALEGAPVETISLES